LPSALIAVINVLVSTNTKLKMTSKVAQIRAQQEELAKQLEVAMQDERADVVALVRKYIVDYKITATELKGLVKGRVTDKQIAEYNERKSKAAAKKSAKVKPEVA
jgi:sulfur relay (sulfurtransferase) DsrC/TusE family protein